MIFVICITDPYTLLKIYLLHIDPDSALHGVSDTKTQKPIYISRLYFLKERLYENIYFRSGYGPDLVLMMSNSVSEIFGHLVLSTVSQPRTAVLPPVKGVGRDKKLWIIGNSI